MLRIGTISANWWRTNYQDGYDFIEKVKNHSFAMPIHIVSGMKDDITPPHSVKKLADILSILPNMVSEGRHLPEEKMPGTLQNGLADFLASVL